MKYPKFYWNEEFTHCICEKKYNNKIFQGHAYCHPNDEDFKNHLTGEIIAELRAAIEVLRYERDFEVRPQLKTLKQLYNSIKHNKHFNPKSIEAKALFKHIKRLEEDLEMIKSLIADQKQQLKDYIDRKEKLYQDIRRKRK